MKRFGQFNLKFLEQGGGSLLHVPLALSLTMLLNIFDVLIIEHGEVGPSFFVAYEGARRAWREEPGYRGVRFY
jgi:hypothetical protein